MQIITYILFTFITIGGFLFLLLNTKYTASHPLNKDVAIKFDGTEMFWLLTFSTGILAFSSYGGIINLQAIRLQILEVFCLIALIRIKRRPIWSFPIWIYFFFIIWLIIGCTYAPSYNYGIRMILKYIYPFLFCLCASAIVRDDAVMMKAGLGSVFVGVLSLITAFVPGFHNIIPDNLFWYSTALAINYISISIFCLSLSYFTTNKIKYFFLFILFLLPCFIWVFRTSIMGSALAISAFFMIKYRIRSVPFIIAIFVLGIAAVFYIPSLHKKMFYSKEEGATIERFEEGKITMNDVHTNGRDFVWNHLEERFYKNHELLGFGTGTVQWYMYSNSHLFNGIKIAHSDFVQQRCDNGIIAFLLFCFIAITIFIHSFILYNNSNSPPIKICAITAGSSMVGVFATCYSDNVVNYSMATLSMPLGFYGMLLGLSHNNNKYEATN